MEGSHGAQRGQILVGEDFLVMFNGDLLEVEGMVDNEVEDMVDKEVEDMVDMVDMVDMEYRRGMASSSPLGQHRLLIVPRAWLRLPRKRFKFIWSPKLDG